MDELIAAYEAGAPTPDLMARYGIGKGTVLNLLRRHDVPLRRQGMTAADIPSAIRLYQDGWSLQRLGERFGCNAETVRKRLMEQGVQIRPRNGWSPR